MNPTEEIVRYVVSTRYEDLPGEVVDAAKRLFMNTLAAMLAGSGAPGVTEVSKLVRQWGGSQEATAVLQDFKAPAHEAVMVNATMARALDFDEFNVQTGIHAGATLIPVALAAAEFTGNADGKEIIAAIAVCSELMSRMRVVPDRCIGISGWTGEIFGTFGAAAATARLMHLSESQMLNSLGLALCQSSGTAQGIYDGVMATRLQQGFSARAGVVAARMAAEGITGARNFLEGKAGFYPVYYRGLDYDLQRLVDGLGQDYRFLSIATKSYPCCGFIQAPAENLLGLMRKHDLSEEDIERVDIRVNEQMYNTVCAPVEVRYKPKNEADAMFALPYVLGTAMVSGDVLLSDFTLESIQEPERLSAADKVQVILDQEMDAEAKRLNLALSLHDMEIHTTDGRVLTEKLYHAKGFPQNPMTLEDCAEKARKCAPFALKDFPDQKIQALKDRIEGIEDLVSITDITDILA